MKICDGCSWLGICCLERNVEDCPARKYSLRTVPDKIDGASLARMLGVKPPVLVNFIQKETSSCQYYGMPWDY